MYKSQQRRISSVTRIALASGLSFVCLAAAAFAFADPVALLSGDSARNTTPASSRSILSLRATPSVRTVSAGSAATYRIRIRRGWRRSLWGQHGDHRIPAGVGLRIRGALPRGVQAFFRPRRTRTTLSSLTLRTRATTPPGSYRVRLRARGHLRSIALGRTRIYHARNPLILTVTAPVPLSPVDLKISSRVRGRLAPGASAPVDVRLTNSNDSNVTVGELTTMIEGISSPSATPDLPCEDADFSVQQYSGVEQLTVPAASSLSLKSLGVPQSQWPRISMANRPVNQDGCKLASLALHFTATSAEGTP